MAASRVFTTPATRYTIAEEAMKKITNVTLKEKVSEAFVTFGIFDQRSKRELQIAATIPPSRNVRKTRVLAESGYWIKDEIIAINDSSPSATPIAKALSR